MCKCKGSCCCCEDDEPKGVIGIINDILSPLIDGEDDGDCCCK